MFSKGRLLLVLALGLASCGDDSNVDTSSVGSAAQTETCMVSKDTTVWNEVPDINLGTYSTSEVGRETAKNVPVGIKRGLLHFDISALPPEALITSATLRLFIQGVAEPVQDPHDLSVTVWRLTADFVEGDTMSGVTWNTQPGVEASPTSTADMDAEAGAWFEMDLTAITIAERESTDPTNVLLRVAPTNDTPSEDRYFAYRTKENGTGADRAQLVINYVIPTATPTSTPTATPTSTPTPSPTPTPDVEAPVITITSPADGSRLGGATVLVTGTVLDGSPITVLTVNGNSITPGPTFAEEISLNPGGNTITVEAVDSFSNMGSEQITVTQDLPPVLGAVGNQTVELGDELTLTLTATDPDTGDSLAFLAAPLPLPSGASLDAVTGVFTYKPAINDAAKVHSLTFLVTDGLLTDEETITITVGSWSAFGTTQLTGRILDANEMAIGNEVPIEGVTIRQLADDLSTITQTTSAADGTFTLSSGILPGVHRIEYDGSTAVSPPMIEYGGYRATLDLVPSVTTIIHRPIYLPHIDPAGKTTVDPESTTVVYNPNIDVTLTIEPHTVKDDNMNDYAGEISVSEVPADFTPGALPEEHEPGLVITVQPMGLTFSVPAAVSFPNPDGFAAGNRLNLWSLNHKTGQFFSAGMAEVSPSGTSIDSLEGSGIVESSWHYDMAFAPTPGFSGAGPGACGGCGKGSCGSCGENSASGGGGGGGDGPGADGSSAFGSTLQIGLGNLGTGFFLPAYNSLGQSRSLNFVYSTIWAYPEQVLPFDATIVAETPAPPMLSYELEVAGIDEGVENFVDTSSFDDNLDETARAAVSFDGASVPTGVYPMRLRMTTVYPTARITTTVKDDLIHVNEQASPFGAGWTLAGLDRLHVQPDGSVLLVQGHGVAWRFTPAEPQAYANLVLSDGPLAYFRLGERQGTGGSCVDGLDQVSDTSVTYNSASSPDWFCGVPGAIVGDDDTAVYVAGTGADLAFRNLNVEDLGVAELRMTGAEEFTLEIWTRFTKHELAVGLMGAWQNNLQGSSQYQLAILSDGKPFCRILRDGQGSPDEITGPTNLKGDNWHHLICRYHSTGIGGDGLKLFVDGQEVASAPTLSGPINQNGNRPPELRCTRGSLCGIDNCLSQSCGPECVPSSGYAGCESGKFLDEGAWYGRALGDEEILEHYEAGALGIFPGSLEAYVSPAGDFSTLVKNADDTFTRTLKNGTKVHFDADGSQTSVEDRNGNTTTYEYNASDQLFRITDPTNQQTTFAYTGNLLTSVTDPVSRMTTFEHDPDGNLVRVVFPDTSTRSFGYDGRHLMTAETDGRLLTTEREYNFAGRVTQATLPDGSVRQTTAEKLVGLVDPTLGVGTQGSPAPLERPVDAVGTLTDGEGRSWEIESGVLGFATSITDRAGFATTYQRDGDGNPTRIVYPSGHAETRTFDDKGNVETLYDETLGGTTMFEYNPVSNGVSKITDPHMEDTIIVYTPEGNPNQITTPEGRITGITYDGLGRPERITDVLGTVTKFTYDPTNGNLVSVLQGENLDPSIQRLTMITPTDEGYVDVLTDAEDRDTDFDYDPMGRVSLQTLPGNLVVDFDYDPNGNLTGLTPPGKPIHSFDYNGVNLEERYTPPQPDPPIQNPETVTIYNDAQQLEMVIRPGGDTITYGYDPGARLETISHSPSGDLYTYSYDPMTGRLGGIEGPTGVDLGFGYLGELLTSETWSGAVNGSVSHMYEVAGRIETETVIGGETITFGYDDDGLLTSATSPSATFSINRTQTTGLIHDTVLGVVADTWDFNEFGELRLYEAEDGMDTLYSVEYERDKLGRITQKTETIGGLTTSRKYEYDPAGRLERVLDGNDDQLSRYVYDDNGNRLEHRGAGDTLLASGEYDDQDRLKTYGGAEYTYGPNGELESKTENGETTTYEYDAFGNLRTVVLPTNPPTTIEYLVDGKNRRVGKKVNDVLVQQLFYGNQLNPVAWIDDQGNLAQFVYGTRANVPDYMIKNGVTYRIVIDHLGSVRLVVNESTGEHVQRLDHDEWGVAVQDSAEGLQPFGFAGGIYDTDTALVRFGARDYDPQIGAWLTKDPFGFTSGDPNLFGYVLRDPVNRIDPTGLFFISDPPYPIPTPIPPPPMPSYATPYPPPAPSDLPAPPACEDQSSATCDLSAFANCMTRRGMQNRRNIQACVGICSTAAALRGRSAAWNAACSVCVAAGGAYTTQCLAESGCL